MLNLKFLKRLILLSLFAILIQILIGLEVREFIDLKIDLYGLEKKNLWLTNPDTSFYIHRSFSIFIFVSNITLFLIAKRVKIDLIWIKIILLLILTEIISGASMYYFSFPILTQPLHLLIAILIFGFQFYWYLIIED